MAWHINQSMIPQQKLHHDEQLANSAIPCNTIYMLSQKWTMTQKNFMAKWDVKDGFWRLDGQDGEEWNFAYVLP
jgi:hypothetical protein